MKPARATAIHVQVQLYAPNALAHISCTHKIVYKLAQLDIMQILLTPQILVLVIII